MNYTLDTSAFQVVNPNNQSIPNGNPMIQPNSIPSTPATQPISIMSTPATQPISMIPTPVNPPMNTFVISNGQPIGYNNIGFVTSQQHSGIPPSAVVAKPVIVSANPVSYDTTSQTQQIMKLNKKGDTKKKMIYIIVAVCIILLLLIAGIITLVWYNQTPSITITSSKELENLDWRVGELTVSPNSFNDLDDTSFIVKNFERLTKITIQDGSCKKVRTFLLNQLPALTSVIIGKECFNNVPDWGTEIALDRSASAEVSDCQSLQVLSMDSGSFVAYGGIKLNNLPSLTELTFGDINTDSSNFYHGSLVLRNLPKLDKVYVGYYSFFVSSASTFDTLDSLTEIIAGDFALACRGTPSTMTFKNLPSLVKITGGYASFRYLTNLIASNVPSLSSIYIYTSAFSNLQSCTASGSRAFESLCSQVTQ